MAGLGYAAVKTATGITVVINGTPHVSARDSVNYDALSKALSERKPLDEIMPLLSPEAALREVASKTFGFELKVNRQSGEAGVFFDGKELHGLVAKRIQEHVKQGASITALQNFLIKAMSGKDEKRTDALFSFVEKNDLPIHPDGDVLAFKAVRPDGMDKHSGTVLYTLGEYIEVENFDQNEQHECSTGLHIGGRAYVNGYGNHGDKYFVVKVNPGDFVSYKETSQWGKTRVRKLFVYAETEGVNIQNALQVLVATVPEGDLAEAEALAADKVTTINSVTKEIVKKPGKKAKTTVVKKPKAKAKSKAAAKIEAGLKDAIDIAEGKKDAPVRKPKVTKAPRPAKELTFDFKGQIIAASTILKGVEKHGQRGYSAQSGIPRSTLQGWLKTIKG